MPTSSRLNKGPSPVVILGTGLVVGGCVVSCAAVIAGFWLRRNFRYIVSSFLDRVGNEPVASVGTVRRGFTDLAIPDAPLPFNHTHPKSAQARSRASAFMAAFAPLVGLRNYQLSRGNRDERAHVAGSREWYWAKDVHIRPQPVDISRDSIVGLVDVDYYVDLPYLLSRNFNPFLLYTFIPESVAGVRAEYSFTFDENNNVKYMVAGAGNYMHQLWNFGYDNVLVVKRFLGLPIGATVFGVDRRKVEEDHALVLFTPVKSWGVFTAWLASLFLATPVIDRLNVVCGKFLRMGIYDTVPKMSTGLVNQFVSSTIPVQLDDAIGSMSRLSSIPLTLSGVQSVFEAAGLAARKEDVVTVVEYHRERTGDKVPFVFPSSLSVKRYQISSADKYDPDAKPGMQPFMSPVVNGAYVPDDCKANEEAAINGRIVNIRSDPKGNAFMFECMDTFIDALLSDQVDYLTPIEQEYVHVNVGTLVPVDIEEVYVRQNRPSQRVLLKQGDVSEPVRIVSSFLKREAYQEVKDPRVISTVNPVDKTHYSQYIYAMADAYSALWQWYAFGKKPKDIAERCARVCEFAEFVCPTDFSRFDGRVSALMRDFELKVLLRAFPEKYHDDIRDLHRASYFMPGYGKHGTKYHTGFARNSGVADTALFNSIINAFIAYYALRSSGVNHHNAYRCLGIYGGDDGLTADVDPKVYARCAADCGHLLEVSCIQRGKFGVTFLARYFSSDVWWGDPRSCCDLPRQLSKLHVTVSLPSNVTPLMKLVEKLRGYRFSDANTPVIGELIELAESMNLFSSCPVVPEAASFWARYDADVHFPNSGDFNDIADMLLPDFDIATFRQALDDVHCPDDLLKLPLCQDDVLIRKPGVTYVTADERVVPSRPKLNAKERRKARRAAK